MVRNNEWEHYPRIQKLKEQIENIHRLIDNLEGRQHIYLNNIRDKKYVLAKRNLKLIHRTDNRIKRKLLILNEYIRELYDEAGNFNTIISEDTDNFIELDKNLERQLLKVQNINKEYLNSKATQNITDIAASSAYSQYYTYTILALILLGYLVLRK
tara:strand:+ start:1951 stop:2418 length:468 start_codon:yes stop_codon:yes gene_type:complete